jgi:hypothetical protein
MPVGYSLFPPAPWHLVGSKAIVIRYEADTERVRALLPPGVHPLEDPVQCLAWCVEYPFSTLGPYLENLMFVRAEFDASPLLYCPMIYVNSDVPLAVGREALGFPKKLGHMRFERTPNGPQRFTLERPAGRPLLRAAFEAQAPADLAEIDLLPVTGLRLIPGSADVLETPSVYELLEIDAEFSLHRLANGLEDVWSGRAELDVNTTLSQIDPFYLVAPTRLMGAYQLTYDCSMRGTSRVLHNYLD